jgi:hypothetical protein
MHGDAMNLRTRSTAKKAENDALREPSDQIIFSSTREKSRRFFSWTQFSAGDLSANFLQCVFVVSTSGWELQRRVSEG